MAAVEGCYPGRVRVRGVSGTELQNLEALVVTKIRIISLDGCPGLISALSELHRASRNPAGGPDVAHSLLAGHQPCPDPGNRALMAH